MLVNKPRKPSYRSALEATPTSATNSIRRIHTGEGTGDASHLQAWRQNPWLKDLSSGASSVKRGVYGWSCNQASQLSMSSRRLGTAGNATIPPKLQGCIPSPRRYKVWKMPPRRTML